MSKTVEQFYRRLRHDTRVHLNFVHNYFILRKLRKRLKREVPERRLVAVMLLEHLGDIVACEPIVRYLREKEPNSVMIWGVKKAYRELIDSNPQIDKPLVLHCLSERLLLMKSGLFDEVVDLHFHDRFCSLCRRPLKKTNVDLGIGLNNYFNYGGLLSSIAQSAGLPSLDEAPRVYIPHSAVERIDNLGLPSKFIAINCTSNANEKNWPLEKWMVLIEKLADSFGIPIYELGLKPLISSAVPLYKSLCGSLSILETAEVIRRAKLFIGIDSGPAHLANAVGTFGVIMFGNDIGVERFNPFSGGYRDGSNAVLLYANGPVESIQVDSVFAEVEEYLDES